MKVVTGHGFNMTSTRVLGIGGLLRPKELDVIYRTVNEIAGSKVQDRLLEAKLTDHGRNVLPPPKSWVPKFGMKNRSAPFDNERN